MVLPDRRCRRTHSVATVGGISLVAAFRWSEWAVRRWCRLVLVLLSLSVVCSLLVVWVVLQLVVGCCRLRRAMSSRAVWLLLLLAVTVGTLVSSMVELARVGFLL